MEDIRQFVFVLNGPPRAGKDTGIDALAKTFPDAEVFQFFRPIKELLHKELGLEVHYDAFELVKDDPCIEFDGKTPRRAYIDRGDRLEAANGPEALTDMYFAALGVCKAQILITTCGKDSEALKLATMFGADNMLVVRVHREGKSFAGDSRSWVVSDTLNIVDLENVPNQPEIYERAISETARSFIAARQPIASYAA